MTLAPPSAMHAARPTSANGAIQRIFLKFGLIGRPSCFLQLVVEPLQSLAEEEHGVVLAREERVHRGTGPLGDLLEALPLDLVRDEDGALLLREIRHRALELVEDERAQVLSLRA